MLPGTDVRGRVGELKQFGPPPGKGKGAEQGGNLQPGEGGQEG